MVYDMNISQHKYLTKNEITKSIINGFTITLDIVNSQYFKSKCDYYYSLSNRDRAEKQQPEFDFNYSVFNSEILSKRFKLIRFVFFMSGNRLLLDNTALLNKVDDEWVYMYRHGYG